MTGRAPLRPACPAPANGGDEILLAHGSGGARTLELIRAVFEPAFSNPYLDVMHDSAVVPAEGERLAVTTDGYVVNPLFFRGGDIGSLAVNGTINDLAMAGARPRYLTASFIIEEGLPLASLARVVDSMSTAARNAGVGIVAGDTKVVDRGKGDQLFITTTGIGAVPTGLDVTPARIAPGDVLILSGDIGRHGIAVMADREGLAFEGDIASDCAPLHEPVAALIDAGVPIHCLRDLTRGGLATILAELAAQSATELTAEETAIPVSDAVRGACELLGLDPLYVANEGRFLAIVPAAAGEAALSALRNRPVSAGATVIGAVADGPSRALLRGILGGLRPLDPLPGDQLPRIC